MPCVLLAIDLDNAMQITYTRLSIRTKLILIYILVAMPLIILLGVSFLNRFQASRQSAIDDRITIARLSASNFTLFINQVISAEIVAGTSIVDHNLSVEQASNFLSQVAEQYPASNVAFLSADGIVQAASLSQTIGQDRSNRPAISAVIGGQQSAIGNLQRNADGVPGFVIATGIRRDGNLAGIVSISINANRLGEVLGIDVARGGVNIVDSMGNLIFQSQVDVIPFDERDWSDESFVQAALAGRVFTSTGLIFPIDNSFRLGAEIPIEEIGWATGSFVPVEPILAPIREAALRSALASLAVILISFALAFLIINNLLSGLLELKKRIEVAPEKGFTERFTVTTGDEVEDLTNSFNRMQDEILAAEAEQTRLQQELQARNRELSDLYEKQKNIASVLQESLLPQIAQKIDNLEIGLEFQSATEAALVGGDFFDFFQIADSKFALVIGDISGKGIEAATLATTIRNTLRAFAYYTTSPAEVIDKVNKVAIAETPPAIFITLFYGIYDSTTLELTYANAGHWPPIIFNPIVETFTNLETGGLPLGMFTNTTYTNYLTKLKEGSVSVLFTDGVIESRSDTDLFGTVRLQQVIKENYNLPASGLAKVIITETRRFGGGRLYDDAAAMVVKIVP